MSLFATLIEYLGLAALALGSLAVVLGALGLLRLGDVYQRMHGTGIVDTGGAGLILLGLLMFSPDWTATVRLVLIGFILVMTGPTATHAIARAVRVSGNEPENIQPKKRIVRKKPAAKKSAKKSAPKKSAPKKPTAKKSAAKKPASRAKSAKGGRS